MFELKYYLFFIYKKVILKYNYYNIYYNIYYIMENKNIEIISFDKNWDISHIKTSGHKLMILCSDILYSSLLEELLKNNINKNVLFDKKKHL
jgi:hypothetical protein